jgi:hypothetical protein
MFPKSWLCDGCNQESISLTDWPVGSEGGLNKVHLCSDCWDQMRALEILGEIELHWLPLTMGEA